MSEDNPTADDVDIEESNTAAPIEEHLKSRSTWTRFLFMILACVLFCMAGFVGSFVVLVGFFWVLFTGEVNKQLKHVGQSIATYMYQIGRYLTYNTDEKPFPFGESWPPGKVDETD